MANYASQISNIAGLFGGAGTPQMSQEQQQLAQKKAADQTMFDRLGITNPLLKQFGQQVAGVTGMDTRSASQAMNSLLQNADTTTPEGRRAVIAAVSKVDPLKAMQLSEQYKKSDLDAEVTRTTLALKKQELLNAKNKGSTMSTIVRTPVLNPLTGAPTGEYTYKTIQYSVDNDGTPINLNPEIEAMLTGAGTEIVDSTIVGSEEHVNQISYYKGREDGKSYTIKNLPDGRYEVYDSAAPDAEPRIVTFADLSAQFEPIVAEAPQEEKTFDSNNPEDVAAVRARASMGRGDRISF